jgi:SAM-dependent methyltransferase
MSFYMVRLWPRPATASPEQIWLSGESFGDWRDVRQVLFSIAPHFFTRLVMDQFLTRFFPNDGNTLDRYHDEIGICLPNQGAMLDLGCGDHQQMACYRKGSREVWGTDFEVHPRLQDAAWFRPLGTHGAIPFPDASFDLITSTWVLEHIDRPVKFLREVGRVLRPGGKLVSLTVNAKHYVSWITRAFHCLPHELTQELVYRLYGRIARDTHPTHFRMNTRGQLHRAAQLAGLKSAHLRFYANPDYFSFSPSLRRIAIVADWLLEQVLPEMGRIYMVVTLEKPLAKATDNLQRQKRAA